MKIISTFFIFFLLNLFCSKSFSQVQNEFQKITAPNPDSLDYFGNIVSIYGNIAAVGVFFDDNSNGVDAGAVFIFEYNGEMWVQTQKIIAYDGMPNDFFGRSVSLNGNRLAVGSLNDDIDNISTGGALQGSAYIYEKTGSAWSLMNKIYSADGQGSDYFSLNLCLDNDRIIVGSYGNDETANGGGAAYIFEYNGNNWIEKDKLLPSDPWPGDKFGYTVSLSGDIAVISAIGDDNTNGEDAGSVYFFEYNGTSWIETAKKTPIEVNAFDEFGLSISIQGGMALVGNPSADNGNGANEGAVYVYEKIGSVWNEIDKIVAPDGIAGDRFGCAIKFERDIAVIGMNGDDDFGNASGSAQVYRYNSGVWNFIAELVPSDSEPDDWFGLAVDAYKDLIFIGSRNDDDGAFNAGSAYLFNSPKGVYGDIFMDINQNCIHDIGEPALQGRMATILPEEIIITTNEAGTWFLDSLEAGVHQIVYDTTGNWEPTCPSVSNFTVQHVDSLTLVNSFGLYSTSPCSSPDISVIMPIIRPCFNNLKIDVMVKNRNIATESIYNGYVDLNLDSFIILTSATLPYSPLGNNSYRFILSDTIMLPAHLEKFSLYTTVDCNAVPGQTLCIEAKLYPSDTCYLDTIAAIQMSNFSPCTLPWDRSSLRVGGWCSSDTLYFTVTNTGIFGIGDMQCYSPVRIYINGFYTYLDSVMLNGGETDTLFFVGDGRTWRIEVDQHPLHPGNSNPNATVELCGDSNNWTPNLFNILPLDDADPIIDIFCDVAIASHDPNDKRGFPYGIGNAHYINANTKLQYLINFQNTGTDTAFRVVLRDTLSDNLDIFSVVPGVSSHNYSFSISGTGVLEWVFNDINLPDSTTNEIGSHGYATFTVDQIPDLPVSTQIMNTAYIYFDFNEAIITNTTSHIIIAPSILVMNKYEYGFGKNILFIYPNPTHSFFTIESSEINNSPFEIIDFTGKIIQTGILTKNKTTIDLSNEANGFYLLRTNGQTIKLIKQ